MKHASASTVAVLEPWLDKLRTVDGLHERRPGVFYFKGRAFVHFHEGNGAIAADIRRDEEFERFDITRVKERDQFVRLVLRFVKTK